MDKGACKGGFAKYVGFSMYWATPNYAYDVTNKRCGFWSTKFRRFVPSFSTPFPKVLATPLMDAAKSYNNTNSCIMFVANPLPLDL